MLIIIDSQINSIALSRTVITFSLVLQLLSKYETDTNTVITEVTEVITVNDLSKTTGQKYVIEMNLSDL